MSDLPAKPRATLAEKDAWVLDYMRAHFGVGVLDADFHTAYHARFGGKRHYYPFGACPVPDAMRALTRLYQRRDVTRSPVRIGEGRGNGWPTWAYVYTLPGQRGSQP